MQQCHEWRIWRSGGNLSGQRWALPGASAIVFNNIVDPVTLEALANREALALAEDLYLHHI